MEKFFNIDNQIKAASKRALELCEDSFKRIDEIKDYNQEKVLKAFIDSKVSESHFYASTGYGYGDRGREALDNVYALALGAEAAIVRHNFVSGTHALTVALFGLLRPGDNFLCVTGKPYDTLLGVIGIGADNKSSLKDFNINYRQIDLLPDGKIDYNKIKENINNNIKMVYIQRSRGYTLRDSLFVSDIEKISKIVKVKNKDCIVMVDNCYGEFVEPLEPTSKGADIIVGSLIKNPGGGIAPCGGYIAGRKDLVDLCAQRLTVPGIGSEIGATLGHNRELFMGVFNAPNAVGEALKTAVFAAALFEILGYEALPRYNESRADIIQVLKLKNKESLISFCKGIQSASPVDSFLSPEPWDMPGYNCKVIMAAGTFTLGASIELSADAPLREPFAAWLQGGLNFSSGKMGVMMAAQNVLVKVYMK